MMLAPTLTMGAASAGAFANAVVVSGAGTAAANGTYEASGSVGGKPQYEKTTIDVVYESGNSRWVISEDGGTILYASTTDAVRPWGLSYTDVNGTLPAPTLTPARA